jgi:hypothetical protein
LGHCQFGELFLLHVPGDVSSFVNERKSSLLFSLFVGNHL